MNFLTVVIDWKITIFEILGGLGIFLFGINLMSDSLKKLAGAKLKLILEKSTNTPLKGIFIGILITGLIQSSTGTTVLVVGLVRAGLMTLPQAVGVIFGANIGTTITSVLIGLKISDYALPIMFLGSFLSFFLQQRKVKDLGKVIIGFGMLFFGLEIMGDALKQLVRLPEFQQMLLSVAEYPILGVLVGGATTAVIQSSSATIGLLQQLYSTGGVPLVGAVAIVLGDNIGTTITSVFASIGGSSASKRTALVHVMFNAIGTIVFFVIIGPYSQLIGFIAQNVLGDGYLTDRMTVSFAHVGFNLMNTFVMYWFIKQLVWLVTKLVPNKFEIELSEVTLEENLIKESPILALENAKRAILNMGNVVKAMYDITYRFAFEYNHKEFEFGMQCEELIDTLDDKIHNYLVRVGANDLDDAIIQELAKDIDTISDLERIGDHLTNLLEFFEERHENKIELHPDAKADLSIFFDTLYRTLHQALSAYESKDKAIALEVNEREDALDMMTKKYRKNHISRINDKTCTETESGFYVDILSNLERIGDHCNNIAVNILSDSYSHDDTFH
ncbi:MAG: Na/Pi cotransporter family protein [bacterium]|nr:Na/Pi cotransporter family protein [bacterium]